MRIAVYGGSFNPPHVGHAMVAAWALWTQRADEVWLVPAFSHPFSKALAPFDDRLEMCRALATLLGPRVRVDPIERELPAPSYSIDTLRRLSEAHPAASFHLVIGADNVPDLPKWKDWPAIERDFAPIVVGREGWPTPEGTIDFPNVSSTEVRRLRAAGADVSHLVPALVLDRMGDLYR